MSDLISRQDAIALLENIRFRSDCDSSDGVWAAEQAIEALTNMPSAGTPDRCETGTDARDLLRYKP